jgi:hypothetical protein
VSEGATGIGASELVDWLDFALDALDVFDAPDALAARGAPTTAVSPTGLVASCQGCSALPSESAAARAELGSAHVNAQARQHASMFCGRDITRA